MSELFAGEQGFIVVLDVETGSEVYRSANFDRCVVSLDWHPSGDRLLGAGGVASRHTDSLRSHGAVWIWDTEAWQLKTLPLPRIARGVDWSPTDDDLFAVSTGDGSQGLWSASAEKQIKPLPALATGVMACQFSPDGPSARNGGRGRYLLTLGCQSRLSVVSYHAHAEGISSIVFSADQQLITGGLDEFIRFWEATPAQDPQLDINQFGKFVSATQFETASWWR